MGAATLSRLADYDGEDTLESRYVYGTKLDEPLIKVSGTGVLRYFHHDRLGSIVAITDDTGAVLNRYAYSPWGECEDMSGTTFGFTGQRLDSESGLYYYKFRHYKPDVGRFLQTDPLQQAQPENTFSLNLYEYVLNDPLGFLDPFGLQQTPIPFFFRPGTLIDPIGSPFVRPGPSRFTPWKPQDNPTERYRWIFNPELGRCLATALSNFVTDRQDRDKRIKQCEKTGKQIFDPQKIKTDEELEDEYFEEQRECYRRHDYWIKVWDA